MTGWDVVLLFAAGMGGGLAGSIAGLASVTTYPALLLVGLPPVAANVTNTVSLIFNGVGSISGSLPELKGQGAWLWRVIPMAAVGGIAGAVLLLSTPDEGFADVVPILLAFASLVIALPPRRRTEPATRGTRNTVIEGVAVLVICVYGGFFGAAAGVLLLAMMLSIGSQSLAHAGAAKNVILAVANGVAAVIFAVFAPVAWLAVIPLGLGCLIGSRMGPVIVRHAPATPLRILIAVGGLALAVKLGVDAYQ
jgi:uncharacterized membrane protein YfcA